MGALAVMREVDEHAWQYRLMGWAACMSQGLDMGSPKSCLSHHWRAPRNEDDDPPIEYDADDVAVVEKLMLKLQTAFPIGYLGTKHFYLTRMYDHPLPARELGGYLSRAYAWEWRKYANTAADSSNESLAKRLLERSIAILDGLER